MMTLEEVRKALQDRKTGVVAEATGLNKNTVSAIKHNRRYNPNYDTYKKLVDYLRGTK